MSKHMSLWRPFSLKPPQRCLRKYSSRLASKISTSDRQSTNTPQQEPEAGNMDCHPFRTRHLLFIQYWSFYEGILFPTVIGLGHKPFSANGMWVGWRVIKYRTKASYSVKIAQHSLLAPEEWEPCDGDLNRTHDSAYISLLPTDWREENKSKSWLFAIEVWGRGLLCSVVVVVATGYSV